MKKVYEVGKTKWIPVDKEVKKNFIGWCWINLKNPLTHQEDITCRFISKSSDLMFATHISPLEKPLPPKTTDNE